MVRLFDAGHPLTLANGEQLTEVDVAYETYGQLNSAGDNAVYICHALTGDAHAAGRPTPDGPLGWWDTMIGPGKAIDTDRWYVVCSNLLGGCQGTTGPSSINPATGQPWGLDFPLLAVSDFVTVHRALLAHLGVQHVHAAVGGSLGGMQVLQWSLDHPDDLDRAVIIAASSRLTAQNIAFSAVGREAIMRDENFQGGRFIGTGSGPDVGLAVARMMAHITYTSEENFEEKFGRRPQGDQSSPGFGVDFAVESYLEHQGASFLTRFDALSYLYLTRVMDYFDPFADPEATDRAQEHPVNYLVISFDSDWRFSTAHSRRIVRRLADARLPVSFREIHSPWGHDSFLLDVPDYLRTVRAFLEAPPTPQVSRSGSGGPLTKPTTVSDRSRLRPDLARLARLIDPGSRVLDLGCGDGSLLAYLMTTRDCTGAGVEKDPQAVLAAIQAGVPVVELDIDTQLGEFADDSFNVIVLSRTLQTLLRPAAVLSQMRRIAPRMIVSMPNFAYWRHRLELAGGRMPRSADLPFDPFETPNVHHATVPVLEDLFRRSGLSIDRRYPLDAAGRRLKAPDLATNLRASSTLYVLRRA